jgi:regulator of sigma E protease
MEALTMTAQLILALAILVTLHELGHYLAARAFGIKVEKFYLFFDAWGFKFFSFKKGDTEYGIGWLPLGGYVKISGMIDESMDREAMSKPPQPYEFRSKPRWQRLIVMLGGIIMNVILGIVIYTFMLLHYTESYLPAANVTDGIQAYDLGLKAGLRDGDLVTEINGKPYERFEDLLGTKILFGADLTIIRGGQKLVITVPNDFYKSVKEAGSGNFIGTRQSCLQIERVEPGMPASSAGVKEGDKQIAIEGLRTMSIAAVQTKLKSLKGKPVSITVLRGTDTLTLMPVVSDSGRIGVAYKPFLGNYPMQAYGLSKALRYGTHDAFQAIIVNIKGLRQIFKGKEKVGDSLQGPVGIAREFGGIWNWARFWMLTGLLSMVLAFMNLLPIPALDGGHVLFLLIEMITQRKLSDKFLEKAQMVGMILLLSLMIFVFGNDIFKALS